MERVCTAPSQFPAPDLPEIAIVGRSNVGKSSLINSVLGRKGLMRVSGNPGCTQAVLFVRVGEKGYVVDLPGYGFARVPLAVKASWRGLVEGYLARPVRGGACLLVDIRREAQEEERQLVEYFRRYAKPFFVVSTKADKVPRGKWRQRARTLAEDLGLSPQEGPIPSSTKTGEGMRAVLGKIKSFME